jgi:hypothetical protein
MIRLGFAHGRSDGKFAKAGKGWEVLESGSNHSPITQREGVVTIGKTRRFLRSVGARTALHTVGRNVSATEPAEFIVILLKKKEVDVVLPAEEFACLSPVETMVTRIRSSRRLYRDAHFPPVRAWTPLM